MTPAWHTAAEASTSCRCVACEFRPHVRPISPHASQRNRSRWTLLESLGWVPLRRGGTGSWVHHARPDIGSASTAAALRIRVQP